MERGCVLCGGSAGCICWFDGGHSDSLAPSVIIWLHCLEFFNRKLNNLPLISIEKLSENTIK